MNRNDVIDVLTAVAAATRRTIGEADVEIWEGVIGGDDVTLALKAVRDHLRDCPGMWLEPGHVHQRVRAYVREALEREPESVRTARQEALAAKVKEDVDELAERKAIPDSELKYRRDQHSPLSVGCPWCKARPFSRCSIPGTAESMRDFHPSRYDAARIAS